MTSLFLPEDIRDYDEDAFVIGGSTDVLDVESDLIPAEDEDWEEDENFSPDRELDIDWRFGKSVDAIIDDAIEFHGGAGQSPFDPSKFGAARPSHIDPTLMFVSIEDGTLLINEQGDVAGIFYSCDISLRGELQGQGLGRELVVEHFIETGRNPVWDLDSAQYTDQGYATFCSAHRYPDEEKATYIDKLVRLILIENPTLEAQADQIRTILETSTISAGREALESLFATPGFNPAD